MLRSDQQRTPGGAAVAVFLAALFLWHGCAPSGALRKEGTSETPGTNTLNLGSGMQASPLDSTNILRSFATRGVVRGLPAEGNALVVKHEEIPGYMPRMTMEFEVRNTNELRGLAVGDLIAFQVKANENESWIENIRRVQPNEPMPQPDNETPIATLLHAALLKPGDLLPDAELVSEHGTKVRLSEFAGKALAFTFIFTRCPLPDYCPRMNRHFSRARELLLQQVEVPANWQFLSISFDPEFDQPGVLNRYAFSYRGPITNQWLFAAAPSDVLKEMSPLLDFRFANEKGSFQHNLRTVVVSADRRVYRQFDGNKWSPEDLAAAMLEASRIK